MIQLILSLWLILALLYSFRNIKIGVAIYLAYVMLVPFVQVKIGPFHFGENLFNILFLAAYFFSVRKSSIKTDLTPFLPFIIYFVSSFVILFFQEFVPLNIMINSWRVDIMQCLILPAVMWNVMRIDQSAIVWFRNTLLVTIFVSVAYGMFLTTTGGFNPYIMYMVDMDSLGHDMEKYYEASNEGRLFGRISSVFIHPMSFALFLGLSFIYTYYIRNDIKKNVFYILLCSVGIMAIFCGVRSVLGGLIVAVAYYFLYSKNYRMMISIIFIGIIGTIVIEQIPALSAYLGSITDIHGNSSAVSGSSVEMRMAQLEGAIAEGSKSPLTGLGYGWVGYYKSMHGDHPVCLAFESLIYVIICNQGLIGFLLWGIIIFKYFTYSKKSVAFESVTINCLLIFYLSYACITGEYGYMKTFLIFYALMLGSDLIRQNKLT